jgi:hypothetical protein
MDRDPVERQVREAVDLAAREGCFADRRHARVVYSMQLRLPKP